MRVTISEHKSYSLIKRTDDCSDVTVSYDFETYKNISPRLFFENREQPCYKLYIYEEDIQVEAQYYVGVDWLIRGKRYIHVPPKINSKIADEFKFLEAEGINNNQERKAEYPGQVNYLKMYLDAVAQPEVMNHIDKLLFIDWDAPQINISQEEDLLTPFLIVQFLQTLKNIVKKGLKKSYYRVQANLESRVRGKILIGQNVKTNILKNRITKTVCNYQEFGIDSAENRFLKKVLNFVVKHVAVNSLLFKSNLTTIHQMIAYCNPAFESVGDDCDEFTLKHIKTNAFFKEYNQAIKTGQYILKRFAYNISNTTVKKEVPIPPFWIDMPRLFELYVYSKLLDKFPSSEVHYHFKTYGNELDFLITNKDRPMVVDAKYKLKYENGHLHDDIRQVAGYSRLNKVLDKIEEFNNDFDKNSILPCLIVYPNQSDDNAGNWKKISAYHEVYKLGIALPVI